MRGATFPIDGTSGARECIDAVHTKIHQGLHFTASQYLSLAAASAMNVLITAPATGEYHFVAEVVTDAVATVTFSKDPNATASGATAIAAYNNNEKSTNTSTLTHVYGGAYTSSGTVLETFLMGSSSGNGANKASIGETVGGRNEWNLATSSTHLIRVVAGAATCQTVVRMYYYREE